MSSLSPAAIDELARREGMSLKHLRAVVPERCHVISERRAFLALFRVLASIAAFGALLWPIAWRWDASLTWRLPLLSVLWFFQALSFVGLFVIGHDCGHLSFANKRRLNYVMGYITMSPILTAFHNWRVAHNHHHAFTQLRRSDTDWPEQMVTADEYKKQSWNEKAFTVLGIGTPVGILVGFWQGLVRRTFMRTLMPQVQQKAETPGELFRSTVASIVTTGGVAYGLVHFGGPWALVKIYAIPVLIAMAVGALLTFLHHTSADSMVFDKETWTPFRGQVVSTFEVRFPRFIEWMILDINIHLPHHLSSRIPWYHLREASQAIRNAFPAYHQERPFRVADVRAVFKNPLLKLEPAVDPSAAYFSMTSLDALDERDIDADAAAARG